MLIFLIYVYCRENIFSLSGSVGYGTTVASHVAMCKEAVLIGDLIEVKRIYFIFIDLIDYHVCAFTFKIYHIWGITLYCLHIFK